MLQQSKHCVCIQAFKPLTLRLSPSKHRTNHNHKACHRHHHRAPLTILARANRNQPVVELLDQITPSNELLSSKLLPDVRKQVETAIERLKGRVTIGDVSAATGLTLFQSEQALKALAADSLATLQVADDGEIVYVFPSSFKESIRAKSLAMRMEPVVEAVGNGAAYLGRVAFGTALIVSIATVTIALSALASSNSRDRDRGGGGYGGFRLFWNISDLFWYWDPYYYRRMEHRRLSAERYGPAPMSFLEAIFSVVFGDGNPNAGYDKERWQSLGRYIQFRGGVVTAEEVAPFLDLDRGQLPRVRASTVIDESFMVPVLARFGGNPEVQENGSILYRFPSLQQTAKGDKRRGYAPSSAAMEETWKLTEASPSQQLGVWALGLVNVVGIASLTVALGNPVNAMTLIRSGLGWVMNIMPALQAYAAAFFLVPATRWLLNKRRNVAIEERNAARVQALKMLQSPDDALRAKLRSAESKSKERVVSERDVIFRTDKNVEQQPVDIEADVWERRLERRASERNSSTM